jgi:hypothetical protein
MRHLIISLFHYKAGSRSALMSFLFPITVVARVNAMVFPSVDLVQPTHGER